MAMEDSLARDYTNYSSLPRQAEVGERKRKARIPKIKEIPAINVKTRSRTKTWSSFEKVATTAFVVLFFVLSYFNVSSSNSVSAINREIQDQKAEISQTQLQNENLEQNAQELLQYDRVYEIANQHGLELNEENIRNVKP